MSNKHRLNKENQAITIRRQMIEEVVVDSRVSHKDNRDPAKINKQLNLQERKSTTSSNLDKPRLNKLSELRKSLNEIKNYEAKQLESTQDLSSNSQEQMNRAVSTKLNFPLREPIFKDLPKIDVTADKLIQRVARRTTEKNRKSQEVRDEINDLINKLVELEYQNERMDKECEIYLALPNEDEFLGLNKFKEPNFHLPNKKTETEKFHNKIHKEMNDMLFSSENYLTKRFDINTKPRLMNRRKECNCINSADFYTRHSMCS